MRALGAHVACGLLMVLLGSGFPCVPLPVSWAQQVDNKAAKKLIEGGIEAYNGGRYEEAVNLLTQAYSLAPAHSTVSLYLGLAYLKQNKLAEAIAAWQGYTRLEPSTKKEQEEDLRAQVMRHLTLLLREENHRQARAAVAREQQIGPGEPQTVAVAYYRNLGSPAIGALQKGLTALLISDIAHVPALKVVERDRLQALLDELQLGSTGVVDAKTAPKVGRLLGAGKVATGSYLDPAQDKVRIDSVVAESTTAQVVGTQETSGGMQQFFDLEKALALAILRDLGYDEQRLRTAGVAEQIRQPQTTNVAAFTAFSRGLDAKDRQDYAAARGQFEEALRNDPNFDLAKKELQALPLTALSIPQIMAAVGSSAPTASAATAGLAGAGLGISTTAVAIGVGVAAVGTGVGVGVASSSGGADHNNETNRCGNNRREGAEQCDGTDLGGLLCPLGGQLLCNLDCTLNLLGCFSVESLQRTARTECNDGNASNQDNCLNSGMTARCGDGFVRTSVEQCDDGPNNSDTLPNACRTNCTLPSCGDGVVDDRLQEVCDPPRQSQSCDHGLVCGDDCTACVPDSFSGPR